MFENVGGKIKTIAMLFFTIEVALSLILGFVMIIAAFTSDEGYAIYGFLSLIVVPIASYISSLILYGFGQLIENTDKIIEAQNKSIKTQANTKINTDKLVSALYENKNQ